MRSGIDFAPFEPEVGGENGSGRERGRQREFSPREPRTLPAQRSGGRCGADRVNRSAAARNLGQRERKRCWHWVGAPAFVWQPPPSLAASPCARHAPLPPLCPAPARLEPCGTEPCHGHTHSAPGASLPSQLSSVCASRLDAVWWFFSFFLCVLLCFFCCFINNFHHNVKKRKIAALE